MSPLRRRDAAPDEESGKLDCKWSSAVVVEESVFSELALEWLELYESCPAATPFQSHAWLESWWREYGKSGRLRVVLVRRSGRLVAAAPLYLQRRRGAFVVLAPLGGGISDYTDFLVRHDQGTETLKRLAVALREQPKWHVLDIPEAREGGAACQLFEVWPGHRKSVASSVCFELPGWPIEDLVSTLPASTAGKTRSKLRKLAVAGILSHTVPPQSVPAGIAAMLNLHEEQWRERGINPEHLRPRFARHLSVAVRGMVELSQAVLTEHWLEGELVASDLALVGNNSVGGYLYGMRPHLRQRVDVTLMLLRDKLSLTYELGKPTFTFLRGQEPTKMRWRPIPVQNYRLLLAGSSSSSAAIYTSAVRSRAWCRGRTLRHPAAVAIAKRRFPWVPMAS